MVQSCKCNCSNRKPCLLACWLLWTSREIRGSTAWHSSSSDEGDTFALWCHTENISITWRTRLGRSHDFWVTFVQNSQVTWRHKLDVLSATWCLAELILLLFAIMLGATKMILDPWAFGSTHLTILVRTDPKEDRPLRHTSGQSQETRKHKRGENWSLSRYLRDATIYSFWAYRS